MPFDVDQVSQRLGGRTVLWLTETDSTMNDAARLAALGAASGTVVGAERQTAGQGRHGRSWYSEAGLGLYFSVILRIALPADELPVATLALGLAAAECITQLTGLAVDLRWPNDVLVGERKVCGILIQQQQENLICGLGLNVNHTAFPEELASIATSLRLETGREFAFEPLFIDLILSIDRHLEILTTQGKEAILRLFTQASSYVVGRRVVIDQGETALRGTTAGLDENGFLILQGDDGKRTVVLAGGVRPA
ncbi:MAG: biotin--[acetyl-CoA-carboxylase] ligase [Bryobacteraceae bacterium]|nr:biotin--[acetyl-CoA-carboxylase] ligase [Bryobacteraceae bacterium]MDW8379105.1 biotin--[acetyl-CoA-carboxylase] ligase [Bryobacterales bacterium]